MSKTKKWIENTALFFYQIFSVDYENEAFINKLLAGGGGNSTLCSTWMHLNDCFVPRRISNNAYELLIKKLNDEDKNKVCLKNNTVYISKQIYNNYHSMFYNNAKGAKNRTKAGKFFHFDHNPSNKKVLGFLNNEIKSHKDEKGFLKKLAKDIKTIQTIDLITVYEDDVRTSADRKGPLTSSKRDELLVKKYNTKFYRLITTN